MNIKNLKKIGTSLEKVLLSIFGKEVKNDPAMFITREIDRLWDMARKKAEGLCYEEECKKNVAASFNEVKKLFSTEEMDSVFTWPRYVKVAGHCLNEPVTELVEYVNESNYISLTKRLSDLKAPAEKEEDKDVKANIERFSKAVFIHILNDIDEFDIPSCLALGKIAKNNGDYDEAREWFERIIETDGFFNGATAILSSYDDETRALLARFKKKNKNYELKQELKLLNNQQLAAYERFIGIVEAQLNASEVSEQRQLEYVVLMTGYARFERNRGNYEKAIKLLERVPRTYPEIYRVYGEEGMIFQHRPYNNRHYSLEKAIESFEKAERAILASGTGEAKCAKSQKSILMPLANAYFQSGRYAEAENICERILIIDSKEQRALELKRRIADIAA